MASSSSIKLLNTLEFCKKLSFGRRAALGDFLEPAMTSANTILQTIVGAPFAWRWNRNTVGFITTTGQQDYVVFNWQATTEVQVGWLAVDNAGNSQKVTTAGTTGGTPPSWNQTLDGTTTDGSAVWTNLGQIGVPVSQTYKFGWIETVSVQDLTPRWITVTPKLYLSSDSAQGRPQFASAQSDDGNGNVTFRLMPVPDQAYPVSVTMQEKPPLFTKVSQTWAPIPDEYSHIYNWGFLAMIWLFSDDPRFPTANQKFMSQLLGANQGLTQTQINIFLNQWQAITGESVSNGGTLTQGIQSRQV